MFQGNYDELLDILNSPKYTISIDILITIYNTLILSHLNYCYLSWGAIFDSPLGLQKDAISVIALNHYKAHTSPNFKTIKVLKLQIEIS